MFSFTLQTNDTAMVSGDVLGQMQYAASNESDGSAAILIGGAIYAQAEGVFNGTQNPTSIVFATATSDASAATGKIKVTDSGHIVPMVNNVYDVGDSNLGFRDGFFAGTVTVDEGLSVTEYEPAVADKPQLLYSSGNQLAFNASGIPYSEPSGSLVMSGVYNMVVMNSGDYDTADAEANTIYFLIK